MAGKAASQHRTALPNNYQSLLTAPFDAITQTLFRVRSVIWSGLLWRLRHRWSVRLNGSGFGNIDIAFVRRPERRKVSAEVQFEVAPNTVSDITHLRTAC